MPIVPHIFDTPPVWECPYPVHFVVDWQKYADRDITVTPPPDPDDPEIVTWLTRGRPSWVVQPYLRLRRRGVGQLSIGLGYRSNAINFVHYDDTKTPPPANCFTIVVESDRAPIHVGEIQITQSPAPLRNKRTWMLIFWPQPGLIAREADRGPRVEQIHFFGNGSHLDKAFLSADTHARLAELGAKINVLAEPEEWADYSKTDIAIGVRNIPDCWLKTKPASKMINAWRAGVIPMLGPEPAYQHYGRKDHDYLEVSDPDEMIEVIRRLQMEPDWFDRLIDQGKIRAAEFSIDRVVDHWIAFFNGPVVTAYEQWSGASAMTRSMRGPKRLWQRAISWVRHKMFWTKAYLQNKKR